MLGHVFCTWLTCNFRKAAHKFVAAHAPTGHSVPHAAAVGVKSISCQPDKQEHKLSFVGQVPSSDVVHAHGLTSVVLIACSRLSAYLCTNEST